MRPRIERMYGVDNMDCITPGKLYDVEITYKQIAPDAWLEHTFRFKDDSGFLCIISNKFIGLYMYTKREWRKRRFNELERE